MIGLDTSHCSAFTRLLNDSGAAFHVPGGKVTVAYPGGSPDFELSRSRVKTITEELEKGFGVEMRASCEEVAENADAILLTSVDGRVHAEQFERIAPYGRPVYIDKPLAVTARDAAGIMSIAQRYGVPVMSTSALRYADPLVTEFKRSNGSIFGVDCHGPMQLEETQPGFFWYGIHGVEMLYAALGGGCVRVTVVSGEEQDVVVGEWGDGRIGTYRGNRMGNAEFGAVIHRPSGSGRINVSRSEKPYYAGLLEQVMVFFKTRKSPVDIEETTEIIRFLESANESRKTGKPVFLRQEEPGKGDHR